MLRWLKFMSLYVRPWTEIGQLRLYYFKVQYSFLWGSWQQFTSSKCRSRRKKLSLHFLNLLVTLKSLFFQFSEGMRRKCLFKTEYIWGWAGHKAVLCISWYGKELSSLPPAACSIPLPALNCAVSKVSSHVWPKPWGGGGEQRESSQHC